MGMRKEDRGPRAVMVGMLFLSQLDGYSMDGRTNDVFGFGSVLGFRTVLLSRRVR